MRDHPGGQPLAEGIIVKSGVPDGDLLSAPRFGRAHRNSFGRNQGNVASAGSPRILCDRQRMEIDDARFEFSILCGGRRLVFVFTFPFQWIVEGPMFDIPLPSLHDCATHTVPTLLVSRRLRFRKMEIGCRHD